MKLKSTLSLLCVTGLMAMALAGCGSSGANSENPTGAASNSASTSGSGESGGSQIIGQVQSISDKTVTLLLGTMEDGGQGQAGGPAQPAGSSASGEPIKPSSDEGQAPSGSQPSGQQPSDQPDGKQPGGGQPGGGKTFVAGTETVFITIAGDTAITVQSISGETDGTIDDIKEGTVLDVVLGDNNTATSVIVKNIMAGPSAVPDDANADLSAGSSSGAQSANN
ncbi:hypothetical protein [Oscillibacter sp.]|uniref:hypothetical protein n=1 Tax=Oscillibacter sp. TaxID=1945593 RepID=UPI002899898B|nr:hypothetical protein [Oscillibacter sp.]